MSQRFFCFLFLIFCNCCFTGCSYQHSKLRFNLVTENPQLDWNKMNDATSAIIVDNIMEGLTSYADSLHGTDTELLRPLPALAESWSILQEGTLYRFHIRRGVHWSDRQELKAQHFVDSWRRLLEPNERMENSFYLFDVEGAQDFAQGRLQDFSKVGVYATDDYTLEVKLRKAAPYFLHVVSTINTFPIRLDLIEKLGNSWLDPEKLVTLGPYQIKKWKAGESIKLVINKKYWGAKPHISEIELMMIAEPTTALALYEEGALDIIPRELPLAFTSYWKWHPDYRTAPKLSISFLAFNVHKAPFQSAEYRRKFIQAISRQALVSALSYNQTVAKFYIPPGLVGYSPSTGLNYDEKAASSLQQILKLKEIQLTYQASDQQHLLFQTLAKQMKENLHIDLDLKAMEAVEYKDFLLRLRRGQLHKDEHAPNLFHLVWIADYPDPHSLLNIFTSASESNYTGWKSKKYDALVEQAAALDNPYMRLKYYEEAQKILLEDEAIVMPLFLSHHHAMIKPYVKNVELNFLDKWYFKNFRIED